jgi:hypothetical protein
LRYDEFDPNKSLSGDKRREYTAGINYFIKGQALKFVLNYVFCQNDATRDSHRFVLGTQVLLWKIKVYPSPTKKKLYISAILLPAESAGGWVP